MTRCWRLQGISFQSTPPARGATLLIPHADITITNISIHAPREGGDDHVNIHRHYLLYISIHAPREGGDRK